MKRKAQSEYLSCHALFSSPVLFFGLGGKTLQLSVFAVDGWVLAYYADTIRLF